MLPEVGSDEWADRDDAQVFTAELLSEAATSLHAFDHLARDPFVVFLEPPSLDERIVNQFALFSLMSTPRGEVAGWLARRPGLCRRLVIPARVKWEIRDKLDQANVNERVLFPGLDGLASWLTRYYAERRTVRAPRQIRVMSQTVSRSRSATRASSA